MQTIPKDILFMMLGALKNCGRWDTVSAMFEIDSSPFQKMIKKYLIMIEPFLSAMKKLQDESVLRDDGPLTDQFQDDWAVLVDEGYQGLEGEFRAIQPKKKARGAPPLSLEEKRENDRISQDRKVSLLDGMALPRAKKRSATVFSRDEIGVEQLQSLKEKFADGDLTEKEFVSLFREIVDASLSETQLTELFQKIDANSDGTVDWDELTNYMFLSGSGSDEYTGDDGNSCYETAYPEKYTGDTGTIPTDIMGNVTGGSGGSLGLGLLPHHKDVITRIVRLERPSVYLTTSKDGSIRTWSANTLAPQQVLASGRDWLTDCCVMKRSNRLAVSSMNRTLSFYDLNSGQLIGDLVDYSRRQCIPLCLAYVERPSDDREAVVVGDDTGGISIFTNGTSGGNPSTVNSSGPVAPSGSSTGSGAGNTSQTAATPTSTISGNPAGSAMLEAQGFSSRVKFQKHTDWITRVKWVNDMRAVVATSLDATVSILDVDRLVVKFEYTRHRKGVFDLAWCASTRLIASCGMERDIHIWNPYSSQRAVATLKGHTSSVLHLVSDDENFQIVSAAADNTVKVWDVRNHRCLQTFIVDRHRGGNATTAGTSGAAAAASMYAGASGANLSAESRVSALLFDGKKPEIYRQLSLQGGDDVDESPDVSLSVARKVKLRGGAPVERPVRLACYNSVFHQVVTAAMDAESAIKTWSAETGEEISSFAHPHGSNPVTSIAFDHAGRRLLTGSHDGEQLKMWNFSNGALVKQFHKKEPPVVSSLLFTATSATAGTVASTAPLPDDPSGEAAATTELPSPTRVRLQHGQDHPTPVPPVNLPLRSQTGEAVQGPGSSPRRTPRMSETSRYRQHEVTSILDIERNLRVGMGDFICQRFVCCVGWDRQLFVWADKNDESEALPVHTLPPNSDGDDEHDSDELGHGRRGRRRRNDSIIRWTYSRWLTCHPLTWLLLAPLHQNSGPIETLWYAEKLELLFAAGERGILLCFDRSMATQAEIPLDVSIQSPETSKTNVNLESVTVLRCDKANTHLVSGDASGCVKVWELRIARSHEGVELALVCTWRLGCSQTGATNSLSAPSRRVLCADFVENLARVPELYLIFSCADGEVGSFGGRHRTWQLGRPATYAFSQSCCDWGWLPRRRSQISSSIIREDVNTLDEKELDEDSAKDDTIANALQPPTSVFIKNCAISVLNSSISEPRENFLLEDTMPKPGEVWMCVSGHRSRAAAQNAAKKQEDFDDDDGSMRIGRKSLALSTVGNAAILSRRSSPFGPSSNNCEPRSLATTSYLKRKIADVNGELTDLITIVKVTRGEIFYWDSATNKPLSALKVLDMSDFLSSYWQLYDGNSTIADNDANFECFDQALNELIAGSTASPPSPRGSTPEALALASSVGMGARTLPLIRPREKRVMGGLLPKRSSVRNRMDPAADIRRIHNPDDIPKNFRAMLQRKRDNKDSSFEGILPES
ncbi:WD40 repeat, conserved site [Phytophthora cactorum]|nr:WD40 repeat, conserved site [Phytophthora cactorum]